jgi:predicted oxidoreductase
VILATGGFQNNLAVVREHWGADEPPARLLKGAGHFATGDGYRLAGWAGADMVRMTDQVTFYTGVPNPRDISGETGFHAQNPAALWLNRKGRRFVDESADYKQVKAAMSNLEQDSFWMFFDADGARKFSVRGRPWINRDTIRSEFLDNAGITVKADSLEALARAMDIPPHNIQATVEIWNRMVDVGSDYQLNRFNNTKKSRGIAPISTPPYYAVKVYPLTRKSMGGPAINTRGAVVNAAGKPIPGLYAAGELTGVAGINGRHGGSGTFLGPSVLTGRTAGRNAAIDSDRTTTLKPWKPKLTSDSGRGPGQPGYWHFNAVHRTVSEQSRSCESCHTDNMPMAEATERYQTLAQLDTCKDCH